MTKMTKAQLVDENIALRHNIDLLERKVARLTHELEEFSNYVPKRAQPQPGGETVVATYTKRDGSCWNKVRIGWNVYAHRQVA